MVIVYFINHSSQAEPVLTLFPSIAVGTRIMRQSLNTDTDALIGLRHLSNKGTMTMGVASDSRSFKTRFNQCLGNIQCEILI